MPKNKTDKPGSNNVKQFFTIKNLNLVLCENGQVFSFETEFVYTTNEKGVKIQTEKIIWRRRTEYENPHIN